MTNAAKLSEPQGRPESISYLDYQQLKRTPRNTDQVSELLERNGALIFRSLDTFPETLLSISNYLGSIQGLPRVHDVGILEVQEQNAFNSLPHTVGSSIDDFISQGDTVVQISPPSLVLIQCVASPRTGGVHTLVDAQRIFEDLWREYPFIAKTLMNKEAFAFRSDDRQSTQNAVLETHGDKRWRIRFQYDLLHAQSWAIDAVSFFAEKYLFNPRYQLCVQLQVGDTLVLDNYRILHAADYKEKEEMKNYVRIVGINDPEPIQMTALFGSDQASSTINQQFSCRPVPSAKSLISERLQLGIKNHYSRCFE